MIVYKPNLRNLGSVNTPYSERFGPVPRCSLFRGFTVCLWFIYSNKRLSTNSVDVVGELIPNVRCKGTEGCVTKSFQISVWCLL